MMHRTRWVRWIEPGAAAVVMTMLVGCASPGIGGSGTDRIEASGKLRAGTARAKA